MKKVLITGRDGQLAWELGQTMPEGIELKSLGIEELDISDDSQVNKAMYSFNPDFVINTADYTAVDKAESDKETAYAVNEKGCEYLAIACKKHKAKLIHVSTDFVFDGTKSTSYQPDDQTSPISVYGASKLAGEIKIGEILGSEATIIRTAWLYSVNGSNFVKSMLRLMQEKEQLSIVYDQVGTPTWAKGLAKVIWALLQSDSRQSTTDSRIFHWTDTGVASWFDFAVAIQELATEKGMLKDEIPVYPIPTPAYTTPAKRPSFSITDKTLLEEICGIKAAHWRRQLSSMLDELNSHCSSNVNRFNEVDKKKHELELTLVQEDLEKAIINNNFSLIKPIYKGE
ncbi:dTDP-4-dehydrorhamnose reductase [Vibrio sp. JC009]|uniref:dTDP-4-dehydrorhamnose reductase n=1 Tax=Vibrio sp. JC009 TaxID=2912314 RepID=UPI0023AF3A60|nr:dTDP-4-dehydrorhamnose reductase [Vibrio sp. JC009]WED24151.1 dTDP-4-dehydrorhamnose reductase [Vibrio sp. JC009]